MFSYGTIINKILRDADYRREFLGDGNNICVVQEEQDLINTRCKKMIHQINKRNAGKLKFKDFAALKTFGRDKISSMKEPQLVEHLPADDVARIMDTFDVKIDQISAIRRQVRGLCCDLAI